MYAKIFGQIFDSSIREEPEVRFTFMDFLVLADKYGVVDMTHEAIAARTNRPIEVIRETILKLESPDPRSRTPDDDGRRIKRLDSHRDWGWIITNYDRFAQITTNEHRREKNKERAKRYREKIRARKHRHAPVTPRHAPCAKSRHVDVAVPVDVSVDVKQQPSTPSQAPNGWSLWVDINRERGRQDPTPLGPDTAAAKRFLKALGVETFKTYCQRFLDDQSPFLLQRGHELHLMAPNKYANAEEDAELFSAFGVKRVRGRDLPPDHEHFKP